MDTVTQTNQGQIAYSYNPTTLQLASELVNYDLDHNGSYEFTRTLDRSQDALLRDTGYSLKTENLTLETTSSLTYSATDGRLAQVSNPLIPNQLFTYSFLANSDLLATVTGPVHTVTNTWEPNRDILASKQNMAGSNVISQYNYAVNAIGQRSGVTTSGSAFPTASSGAWGYDLLGQVITSDRAFQYGAQSRRIAKIAGTTATSAAVIYLYDAWNSIAEYTRSAGPTPTFTLQKTRLWGQDLSGTLQGAGGVVGLLSETLISNPQSPISYPTYDGNGNVSEYLTATGTLAAHYEYDPFGNTVVNTDTSNLFTYKFSTKPQDTETGLYYYGYRYYDLVTGRWPSRDPIEERGGINLYIFVGNDQVNRRDYLGLVVRYYPFNGGVHNNSSATIGVSGDYEVISATSPRGAILNYTPSSSDDRQLHLSTLIKAGWRAISVTDVVDTFSLPPGSDTAGELAAGRTKVVDPDFIVSSSITAYRDAACTEKATFPYKIGWSNVFVTDCTNAYYNKGCVTFNQ